MYKKVLLDKLSKYNLVLDDFDLRNDFTNNIINNMTPSNLIGKGAVGKVFSINNNYVVKQVAPCNVDELHPVYKYCNDLKTLSDKSITVIPGGMGKKRYILPNLLSEIVIGVIMGDVDVGFANTIASMIVNEINQLNFGDKIRVSSPLAGNLNIYIVMNKLQPFSSDRITDMNQLNYFLFQIAHNLLTAQQLYKFTHYDLHIENILLSDWPNDKSYISYPLPNNNMRLMINKSQCPFMVKISDFALARLETKEIIVAPSIDTFPLGTYGEFSYFYDYASILGSILIDNKYRKKFDKLFKNKDIYRYMLQLTLWYFNDDKLITNDLNSIRNYIGDTYYKKNGNAYTFRLKQEKNFIPYINTKSLVDVVNYIAKELIINKSVVVHKNTNDVIVIKDLSPYTLYDKILLHNPPLLLKETPLPGQSISTHTTVNINKFLTIKKYHLLFNNPPKSNNFTLTEKQKSNCPIQEHFLTVLHIDRHYKDAYQFKFDCCKLDLVNYLLQNQDMVFVVNAGFFNAKKDFLPIGPYKDEYNTINNYKIPELYKDVYGYVILKNNILIITRQYNPLDQLCSSGPILIENGKIMFDSDEARFNCHEDKFAGQLMLNQDDDYINLKGYYKYNNNCDKTFVEKPLTFKRCDKIIPGELNHANNPNARTVLCMMDNGDYIFVAVQGRDNEGVGIGLHTLAKSLLNTYPTIKHAINQDGGRSSAIVWRTHDTIYNSNPDRHYYYPLGNLIGMKLIK